ncbi:kinase-like domain-containing protein [Xylaria telfairii]|nr:kinase-like domain-containing protein [Xylaria telfairii]
MDKPFATLEPSNASAKLAFSEVCHDILSRSQQTTQDKPFSAHCMVVENEQIYDKDVLQFQRERAKREAKRDELDSDGSLTECDSDVENELRPFGMIWSGHYILQLNPRPRTTVGWTVGRMLESDGPSMPLCTPSFLESQGDRIRSFHARFQFHLDNKAFFVALMSRSGVGVAINGQPVGIMPHTINQSSVRIQVCSLEYIFKFSDYSYSDTYNEERQRYMSTLPTYIARPEHSDFEMPTPQRGTTTIGQWALSRPLGKGSLGKVYLASNWKNEVVAVKTIQHDRNRGTSVDKEIAACRALTDLAKKHEHGDRILQLKEIIDPRTEASSSTLAFVDVHLILEPMTPKILTDVIHERRRSKLQPGRMSIETATIFRDILLGLQVMHDNGWVHCDIKPANVGVRDGRAVLLDVGQAQQLPTGTRAMFSPAPGHGGTVNCLSPEREMSDWDQLADVWSVGCIGFELAYGRHPFKFTHNPWRRDTFSKNQASISSFKKMYQEAIDKLSADHREHIEQSSANNLSANEEPRFVHPGALLIEMLRHKWAEQSQSKERISIKTALEHSAWSPFLPDNRKSKRIRID